MLHIKYNRGIHIKLTHTIVLEENAGLIAEILEYCDAQAIGRPKVVVMIESAQQSQSDALAGGVINDTLMKPVKQNTLAEKLAKWLPEYAEKVEEIARLSEAWL